MAETKEQRIQRRLDSAIERSRREEEIKGGIASMWESLNPAQKVGMSPIGFPVTDLVGLAGDVQMYNEDPEMRSPVNYALSGAGLLPFVPSAATTVLKKAKAAKSQLQKNAEIAKANRKRLKDEDIDPETLDEMIEDYAGENLYVEEGTGRIGAFDRMWPNIPRSHRGDDMTGQFLEEMGYKEVFDVWEKAPNTFIRDGDKVVTYTPSFNKSGIEQKTFKDPTFGELGDFFGGFSKGGTVTKSHGGMVDKAIAGGSKDI
tara:strand:- start:463 stop:1239 length:777 start_codon:yes stop_codon:yes gene_type:complete